MLKRKASPKMRDVKYMSIKEITQELKSKLINYFIDTALPTKKSIDFVGRVGLLVDEIEERFDYLWGKNEKNK